MLSRGSSFVSFEALARDSAVVDYRLAATVAQSGVVTPIALTEERSYIRNVTTERGDDNNPGKTSYEIGELETGLSIAALARLVEGRRIQLAISFSQRAFRGFDADVLARTGTIQAPTVDQPRAPQRDRALPRRDAGPLGLRAGHEPDGRERAGNSPAARPRRQDRGLAPQGAHDRAGAADADSGPPGRPRMTALDAFHDGPPPEPQGDGAPWPDDGPGTIAAGPSGSAANALTRPPPVPAPSGAALPPRGGRHAAPWPD